MNQSLLVLGYCIQALSKGQQHIGLRNSKLTRLMKDSLEGHCWSTMVACISGEDEHYEETIGTLGYAQMASRITLKQLHKNTVITQDHISNYNKISTALKHHNQSLKQLIQQAHSSGGDILAKGLANLQEHLDTLLQVKKHTVDYQWQHRPSNQLEEVFREEGEEAKVIEAKLKQEYILLESQLNTQQKLYLAQLYQEKYQAVQLHLQQYKLNKLATLKQHKQKEVIFQLDQLHKNNRQLHIQSMQIKKINSNSKNNNISNSNGMNNNSSISNNNNSSLSTSHNLPISNTVEMLEQNRLKDNVFLSAVQNMGLVDSKHFEHMMRQLNKVESQSNIKSKRI